MGKLGRNWCVYRQALNPAVVDIPKELFKTNNVHRFCEHVLHDFVDQRMIGNLDLSDDVLRTRLSFRKNRSQQIVGAHSLDLRGDLFSSLESHKRQRATGIPPPSCCKQRRIEHCLFQNVFYRVRVQEVKDVGQWKTVLFRERNIQAVVCCGGLQLEIEGSTKTFPQGQSPCFVNSAT